MKYVAFIVVVLGTFAVMLITFPAAPMKLLLIRFCQKFFFIGHSLKNHTHQCFKLTQTKIPIHRPTTIDDKLFNDGLELIDLGFSAEQIQDLISSRFEVYIRSVAAFDTMVCFTSSTATTVTTTIRRTLSVSEFPVPDRFISGKSRKEFLRSEQPSQSRSGSPSMEMEIFTCPNKDPM